MHSKSVESCLQLLLSDHPPDKKEVFHSQSIRPISAHSSEQESNTGVSEGSFASCFVASHGASGSDARSQASGDRKVASASGRAHFDVRP